ncbi:HNH endonuclease [Vibrio atlanticus]|uniref:HNH endonuclease n=1 Tax=Vibrio atlanticus TaxID=693153 RepID=UPI0022AF5FCF|nr:HNH endonuclease [Vibrio atlanticus]MCZ4311614.1 HNH endonuclease [Vibrio atlanticus]
MVASLNSPVGSSKNIIRKIIWNRGKQRDFFNALEGDWLQQVSDYVVWEASPKVIYPLDLSCYITQQRIDEEKLKSFNSKKQSSDPLQRLIKKRSNSLIKLYSPELGTELHQMLFRMRKKHKLLACPSCGEDGAPTTLDHYLPKERFPELSICIENLTPMCTECQTKKHTHYSTSSGLKRFFHPYFDVIRDSFFHVEITPPFDAPRCFELKVVRCEPKQARLLLSHIVGIQLKPRIEEYCESMHDNLVDLFQEGDVQGTAKDQVNAFYRMERKKLQNSWGAIYYLSVLNTPSLLTFLDKIARENTR